MVASMCPLTMSWPATDPSWPEVLTSIERDVAEIEPSGSTVMVPTTTRSKGLERDSICPSTDASFPIWMKLMPEIFETWGEGGGEGEGEG